MSICHWKCPRRLSKHEEWFYCDKFLCLGTSFWRIPVLLLFILFFFTLIESWKSQLMQEGWHLSETFQIRCVIASPYVVPYRSVLHLIYVTSRHSLAVKNSLLFCNSVHSWLISFVFCIDWCFWFVDKLNPCYCFFLMILRNNLDLVQTNAKRFAAFFFLFIFYDFRPSLSLILLSLFIWFAFHFRAIVNQHGLSIALCVLSPYYFLHHFFHFITMGLMIKKCVS